MSASTISASDTVVSRAPCFESCAKSSASRSAFSARTSSLATLRSVRPWPTCISRILKSPPNAMMSFRTWVRVSESIMCPSSVICSLTMFPPVAASRSLVGGNFDHAIREYYSGRISGSEWTRRTPWSLAPEARALGGAVLGRASRVRREQEEVGSQDESCSREKFFLKPFFFFCLAEESFLPPFHSLNCERSAA